MKKPELASEKGKIKEAKDPAGWYMGHELLSHLYLFAFILICRK